MGPGSRFAWPDDDEFEFGTLAQPLALMLAVNAAVLAGVFLHKIALRRSSRTYPFAGRLPLWLHQARADRRRRVAVTDKVPVWLVFALAGTIWLVNARSVHKLFRRTFGFDDTHWPLFVFIAESPFFLKNFMHTPAISTLWLRTCARAAADSGALDRLRAGGGAVLDRADPDPPHQRADVYADIAAIVVLRFYLVQGMTPRNAAVGIAAARGGRASSSWSQQFAGTIDVPYDDSSVTCRANGRSVADRPARVRLHLVPALSRRLRHLGADALEHPGHPVFALLIWLHTPLCAILRSLIARSEASCTAGS